MDLLPFLELISLLFFTRHCVPYPLHLVLAVIRALLKILLVIIITVIIMTHARFIL